MKFKNKEHMNIKTKFYINGDWINPVHPNEFEVINPSNEEVCATISLGTQTDTDLVLIMRIIKEMYHCSFQNFLLIKINLNINLKNPHKED